MKDISDLYKLIVDNIPSGVWVSDRHDKIVFANEAMCNLAGVPCSEIVGRSVSTDFSPETVDEFAKHYQKVKNNMAPGEYEAKVKTPAGKDTIQRGWLIPIAEEGKFAGMIVTVEDITEKGILEKKLIESERVFRLMANNSVDVIWRMDIQMRFTYVSPSFYDLLGYKPEEVIGKRLSKFASWSNFYKMAKEALLAVRNYKKFNYALIPAVMKRKDGSDVEVEIIGKLVLNEAGLPVGFQGNTRDISDRKLIEKKLIESEKLLRSYFESAPDGIFIADENGFYIDVNESACKQLGYTENELLKMHVSQTVPEELIEESKRSFENVKINGKNENDIQYIKKSGETGWWKLSAIKISDDRYLGFTKDITKEKEAAMELEAYRDNLEKMVQDRTKELEEKNEKLSKFNKLFVEREFRIKELRDRVKELEGNKTQI